MNSTLSMKKFLYAGAAIVAFAAAILALGYALHIHLGLAYAVPVCLLIAGAVYYFVLALLKRTDVSSHIRRALVYNPEFGLIFILFAICGLFFITFWLAADFLIPFKISNSRLGRTIRRKEKLKVRIGAAIEKYRWRLRSELDKLEQERAEMWRTPRPD